jgi:hypothetical protein
MEDINEKKELYEIEEKSLENEKSSISFEVDERPSLDLKRPLNDMNDENKNKIEEEKEEKINQNLIKISKLNEYEKTLEKNILNSYDTEDKFVKEVELDVVQEMKNNYIKKLKEIRYSHEKTKKKKYIKEFKNISKNWFCNICYFYINLQKVLFILKV